VLVGFINVIATYAALKLMDTTARRTLILLSTGGMVISTAFIIAAQAGLTYKPMALFGLMSFVGFYAIGLGPIPWLIGEK
jgi:SP family facilitated glucose transporter-like MFS transporter 3